NRQLIVGFDDYNQVNELVFESRFSNSNGVAYNRIFFGAPGTGKSFKLEEEKNDLLLNGGKYERVTFHPDYSYAQFVGTYKPVPSEDENGTEVITYKYTPGPFMRILVESLRNIDSEIPHLLIIEEINRANVAAVFGEVFQLLDRTDGVSEYAINLSEDMKSYISSELGIDSNEINELKLPD
ncbi:TPA: AAA family ATPase, partial [Streptococcus suis]|nr:AAA family ATPase [Streptococcus suis]